MVLKNYFDECGDKTSLKDYLREVIKQTGAMPEHLAKESHLDVKHLQELAR
jgi:hypothetical protein